MGGIPRSRLDSLTSLRFFAAFGVVVYHCALYMPDIPWPFHALVQYGHAGVTFFFVLSGFVLTWSRRTGDTKRNFYIRRFARVWPSHFVTTLLAIPVMMLAGEPALWAAFPAVLLLLHAWIPPGSWHYAFNGPSWSLSAEAFFYALFPLLVGMAGWRTSKLRRIAILTCAALLAGGIVTALVLPSYTWGFILGVNPAYRVGEFILGIVIALAVERGRMPRIPMTYATTILAASYVGLAIAAWAMNWGELPAFVPALVLLAGFVLLIISAAQRDIEGRTGGLLSSPIMLRLGEASFALYLVHALVIHTLVTGFSNVRLPDWAWLLLVIPSICLSLILAWLLHVQVEIRAEKFIRHRFVSMPRRTVDRAPVVSTSD